MKPFPLLCLLAMWLVVPMTAPAAPAAQPADATSACTAAGALPTAAQTFTLGTLRVQRYGNHGRPVILIPGLGSGAWVWADTIRHLRGHHLVYALTLAGFDGVPAPEKKTHLLDQADASLLKLIQSRHIDHPVLVGHSLGGTLAIRFAGEHSDLLSGVVAVDGLPVFPVTQNLTTPQRQARAQAVGAQMAVMTPAQFKAQQLRYMQHMGMIAQQQAACYAQLQAKSDPVATATYMRDDLAHDYRPLVKRIHVPLLEISPYNAPDFKAFAARTGRPAISAKQKAAYYRQMLANDPQAKVVTIAPSRHFVMLDQPQKFVHVLDGFLSRLPKMAGHD